MILIMLVNNIKKDYLKNMEKKMQEIYLNEEKLAFFEVDKDEIVLHKMWNKRDRQEGFRSINSFCL